MNIHLERYKQQILESMGSKTTQINEALSPEQRQRLDSLISMFRSATDPEADYFQGEDEPGSDEVLEMIRSEFGDQVAQQVDAGQEIMHFGRPNERHGYDHLDKAPPRITSAGKMHKTDIDERKRKLRSRFQQ